jgi:radical SAM protein (TIGR01212 family)
MNAPKRARYRKHSAYLRERFGAPVRRIPLHAGFSCPNRDGTLSEAGCVFCDPKSYSPAADGLRTLEDQLREGIERGRRQGVDRFLAYFQPYTNTYAPLPQLRRAYDAVRAFPEVVALAVGTRPDCVDEGVIDLLAEYTRDCEVWVEYGLQSIHDRTLRRLNRGHTAADFLRAVELTRRHPELKVCAHVILGLPGEDPADEAATAEALAHLRVEGVKVHPLYVVMGTALAIDYAMGRYAALTREDYTRRAVAFLERLPPAAVVQRLSADCPPDRLLAPAWLTDKHAVVAGIEARLESEDTWQGKRLGAQGPNP